MTSEHPTPSRPATGEVSHTGIAPEPAVGEVVGPVRIDAVAHGGHFVGRWQGRVLFVRHTMLDELVMVRLTDTSRANYWLADAVEVLEASPDRVEPPCPVAGQCGGCDFQHLDAGAQRLLKARIVAEQMDRLAGIDVVELTGYPLDQLVEPANLRDPGALLGWRTRVHYRTLPADEPEAGPRLALRRHRSHDLVALPHNECLIAHPDASGPRVAATAEPGPDGVLAVVSEEGATIVPEPTRSAPRVHHVVNERRYEVSADGFWQVHALAPTVLADAVLDALRPREGETALDLYCGVGLFAGQLVDAGVRVEGVESDAVAVASARRNVPEARFHRGPMERLVRDLPEADLVVLDPPRKGAGAAVVRAVAATGARAVAYVACDPAALARDVATFAHHGYRVSELRAFDLFPMTHHVECVALLVPER